MDFTETSTNNGFILKTVFVAGLRINTGMRLGDIFYKLQYVFMVPKSVVFVLFISETGRTIRLHAIITYVLALSKKCFVYWPGRK